MDKRQPVHCHVVERAAREKLEERGVDMIDIAKIVFKMQAPYTKDLSLDECIDSVNAVLTKREMQHAILVGVELDKLAEEKKLSEPLQSIVETDEGLFGIDETIALGSVFGYGSIAVTTFGYLDKEKIGIIKELDSKGKSVNTFLDDLIASIAANASSRIAHRTRDKEERLRESEMAKHEHEARIG